VRVSERVRVCGCSAVRYGIHAPTNTEILANHRRAWKYLQYGKVAAWCLAWTSVVRIKYYNITRK
jgi:hypothetical protein